MSEHNLNWSEIRDRFCAEFLPVLNNACRKAFAGEPAIKRESAGEELVMSGWVLWRKCFRARRDPHEVGLERMAHFLIRKIQIKRFAQQFSSGKKDPLTHAEPLPPTIEATQASPVDRAAHRVDFAEWFGRLELKEQLLIQGLILGHSVSDLSEKLKIPVSRINKIRLELATGYELRGE